MLRSLGLLALAIAVGCGGDDVVMTPDGGSPPDSGGGGVDAGGVDGGGSIDGGIDAGAPDAGPPCPETTGVYEIDPAADCGDLDFSAPQMIVPGAVMCDVTFTSVAPKGFPGVNGDATLDMSGGFGPGVLTLGTVDLTGCSGVWDEAAETMTIMCVGATTCTVTLHRTGALVDV